MIAFDFTCLQTFQAKAQAAYSSSVGLRMVGTLSAFRSVKTPRSRSCTINPPTNFLRSKPSCFTCVSGPTSSKRRSFLRFNSASASTGKSRRNDHFDKRGGNFLRCGQIHGAIECNDATER